jgi:hypothetical protein
MNIKSIASGLEYIDEVQSKRQTYYVFQGKRHYAVLSLSKSRRNAGNFNVVSLGAVEYIARRFAGKKKVTSKSVWKTAKKPQYVATSLEALTILYILVAAGKAKIDTRYQEKQLYFNIKR